MPELPDLIIVAEQLAERLTGREVLEATAPAPILVRATPAELASLAGSVVGRARRRGKFLLLPFERDGREERLLAANPMLAGRFWLLDDGASKMRARTGLRLRFADGSELRYVDREMLGKLYLVPPDGLDAIPGWTEMGPDADDPELTAERFRERIRRHPGELKSLLRNSRFVAGIGNAYSDEILWAAQLAPLRRRSTLRPEDIDRLYDAMRTVLADAVVRLRDLVPPDIQLQHREFLKVHLRGGEPCPRCGRPLRQIGGDEATTFCRTCQPPM
ncbi:MAG TPA: DNA-formamidopyrimidine glycosylase family protein [Candidatus Dormibacteraeota bacterium]|nr:DNA-formamidopyrimidine glycosylase family protein [Candidatus Dormibacteraeota bacterium]